MIKGKTSSGFEYKVEDDSLDDYELLEVLQKIDEGNGGLVPKMITLLLGEEQKERLKEHVRKDGKVSASAMMDEISEILEKNTAGKNS